MSSEPLDRDAPSSRDSSTGPTTRPPLSQWAHVIVLCSIVLVNLIQRPGYTTFDTKLDLTENPGGFMRNALNVWSADVNMGSLQNQAYGYIFPVAPFFWLGESLGVPMWLWQRVWSALVLLAAYEGMRRLARATGGLSPGAAVIAGLSFALAPRVLSTVGVLSGETLPGAILPWTVLPLVHAWHGRQGWGRAVLLSAATLPFMAGLNATEVLCALPLPGLVIICAPLAWRLRIRWAATWCGLVLLACAWWIVPLLVLGRYAPPFLDYIESGENTTGPLGWLSVLRGSSHWLSFLSAEDSHWYTGYALTYSTPLVVIATVVSIVGLLGLTARRTPLRRPFLIATGFGLIVMALGHGGLGGSLLGDGMQAFLDGAGAPFRNIHKFDPLVRAGVAIGLGWVVTWAAERITTSDRGRRLVARAPSATRLPAALAFVMIGTLSLPAMQGELRAVDGWREFPTPWQQMQGKLDELPESARVLVLPGTGFANSHWGRTVDEPIQTMEGISWSSRSQIPLVSPGGLRLLESIEERVGTGRSSDELAPMLAQAGFTHVLVRNDLKAPPTSIPSSARLHASIERSEGFRPGPSYGVGDGGYPMVELFSLTGAVPRARAVEAKGLRELAGESDQLVSLAESGVLRPDELTVGRGSGLSLSSRILTEGAEKRERSFGRVHDAITSVRTKDQPWEQRRAAYDYGTTDTKTLTTVDYGPVASMSTSSAADSARTIGPVRRDQSVWAAFDRSPHTKYTSAPYTNPTKQWIALRLKKTRRIGDISITLGERGAQVSRLTVTTDAGSRDVRVPASGEVQIDDLRGKTDEVRIEVQGIRAGQAGQVHISDVRFSELKPTRTEVVDAPADSTTTMAFRGWPGRAECIAGPEGVHCEPWSAMNAEEAGGLARQVRVTERGSWNLTGEVRTTGGKVIDDLLLPLDDGVVVRASTSYATEALSSPTRAVDGDETTGWTSGVDDQAPWIDLSWKGERKLSRFTLRTPKQIPGAEPAVFGAAVDGEPVKIRKKDGGWELEKPVRGSSLRITFHPTLPNGRISVGEVEVQGLGDLTYRPDESHTTGVPCGFGPPVTVGDQKIETKVTGTLGDIRQGRPMKVESCSGPVALEPGSHRLSMAPAEGFAPTGLTLTPEGLRTPRTQDLPLAVSKWGPHDRTVSIGGTEQAVLAIPENINDGWVARSGGEKLDAITVDGWKQGFVVPAGANRVVELSYTPATPYRAALFGGGAVTIVLVLIAGFVLVRGREHARFGGPAPAAANGLRYPAAVRRTRLGGAGLTLGLGVFAGLAPALGFLATIWLGDRRRRWARWAAVLVATGAALWWGLSPFAQTSTTVVDILVGAVVGLALGLAYGPVDRAKENPDGD